MSYTAYRPVIDHARPYAQLWRLGLGICVTFAIAAAWVMGLLLILAFRMNAGLAETRDMLPFLGLTPSGTALFLFFYGGLGYGTLVTARWLHKRGPRLVVGTPARTLRHFSIAAALTFAIMALVGALTFGISNRALPNLDLWAWLKWLPLGLVVVAVQTGSEELFFRGYLQSQLAARFRRTWVWLLTPSIAFGALHYLPNVPLPAALTYAAAAAFFGLLAADLTARTGTIGAAWGIHFANNSIALLIVAADPDISGLALYRSGLEMTDWMALSPLVILDLITLAVIWALTRKVLTA